MVSDIGTEIGGMLLGSTCCIAVPFIFIIVLFFLNWLSYRAYRINHLVDRDLVFSECMCSQLMAWVGKLIGTIEINEDNLTIGMSVWSKEKIPSLIIPRKNIIGVIEDRLFMTLTQAVEIYYDKEGQTCCVTALTNNNKHKTISSNFVSLSGYKYTSLFGNRMGIFKNKDTLDKYFGEQPTKEIENKQPTISETVGTAFVDARYLREHMFDGKTELSDEEICKLPFSRTASLYLGKIEVYDSAIKVDSLGYLFIIPKKKITAIRKLVHGFSIIHNAKNAPERVDVYHGKIDVIEAAFRNFGYPIQ